MYYLRLSVRHWFVTAGPGVRFQQTVRDSQRTADIHFTTQTYIEHSGEPTQSHNSIHAVLMRLHKPSCLSSSHRVTASHHRSVWGLSRCSSPKGHAGYDTQAAGWCVHLGLPLIRWQRSGADRWRPRGEEDKLRGSGLKRRSIMWSRGIISSLEMYFYSEWLCYGDIF